MEIKDKIERVKVKDLKFYPDNPRKHSKDQIDKLAKQIKQVGFNQPIIIDEDNQVLVGNGRLEAADFLTMDELPCIRYSELTQLQKKQLILADNKLNDLSDWDNGLLNSWLKELVAGDVDAFFTDSDMVDLDAEIKLDTVENTNLDEERFKVIELVPPEAPRLKERAQFSCPSIEDYKKIKEFFEDGGKLNVKRLLALIE